MQFKIFQIISSGNTIMEEELNGFLLNFGDKLMKTGIERIVNNLEE